MYHTIILVGNLGKDPEMRYTPSGQAVTSFSVATNRSYAGNNGQTVKETVWFKVNVWGKQAESCNNYLRKGNKVLIEGRLQADPNTGGPRTFTRQDGTTGTNFEIVASMVRFLTPKGGEEDGGSSPAGTEEFSHTAGPEEEIPF